jgi:hypothetical protein
MSDVKSWKSAPSKQQRGSGDTAASTHCMRVIAFRPCLQRGRKLPLK